MYPTKAGKNAKARAWERKAAHPASAKSKPTYMGFRLKR
jgi:hypothetical protein